MTTFKFQLLRPVRIHLLLQREGILEVQQPAAARGAWLPEVHPQGLHGLRRASRRPRVGLEPAGGRGAPLRQRQRGRGDAAGHGGGHGEGRGHRHPLRAGAVHDGPPLHRVPVPEEEHAAPHTVLQALHAGVGVRS